MVSVVCMLFVVCMCYVVFFFFQAEDGIRALVRSRGLGDVYKRQPTPSVAMSTPDGGAGADATIAATVPVDPDLADLGLSLIHI